MHDALEEHLGLMLRDGDVIPAPSPLDQIEIEPGDVVREVEV